MGTTNKKIGIKKAPVKAPSKHSINLASVGVEKINFMVAVPAIILIAVAAALLSKFGVIDRFVKVSEAEHEVAELQRRIDEGYDRIAGFGSLQDSYAHYTYSDMTEEELNRADRVEAMKLLRRVVLPKVNSVTAWNITGNRMIITMNADTLQDVNLIKQQLEAEPMVDYCFITTAQTVTQRDENAGTVTANVTVYLSSALQEVSE